MYDVKTDFSKKTKELLENYERSSDKKHEVSLLMDCCVGLLLMPKEKALGFIKAEESLTDDDWAIAEADITLDTCPKSLKNTIRHLRNSVAHTTFEFKGDATIDRIVFKDRDVTINITVEQFKKFVFKLVDKCSKTEPVK